MWDLIVSVPDHCLSFYFPVYELAALLVFSLEKQMRTNYVTLLRHCSHEIANSLKPVASNQGCIFEIGVLHNARN